VKSAITGGAALGPDTFRLFQAMGLPMRQIYGQTELAGAYTTHDPQQVAFDTVGVPFPGTELRIDNPDENGVGEIVARTPGMFTGYYRDENSTGSAMRDGWFHTGDAGYISGTNGHLVVIDRISELATTNSGVRFSPQFIENKLKFSPFVGEAVVLGNGRDFLSAIICIRFSIMSKWAEQRRIAFTNYTDLASRPEVQALIRDEIATANKDLPSSQQIKRFVLLYKELDADDDELTRTRKIRRSIVNEKYKDIVEAIYNGSDIVHVDTQIVFQDGSKSRIKTNLNIVSLSASASNTRKQAA
jgi:long-chain acyl-CoA synthetase